MTLRLLTLIIFIASSAEGFAQLSSGQFMADANGRPLYRKTEYTAEGSPYYYDEYCLADIYSVTGKVYGGVPVKFNIQDNLVVYDDNGKDLISNTLIRKIKFYNYAREGVVYPEVELVSIDSALNVPGSPVYVALYDGTAKLLTRLEISYSDITPYGASTIVRTFKRKETLYAYVPTAEKQAVKVSRKKSEIAGLFGSAAAQIDSYIAGNRIKVGTDKDLISVFRFYDSLPAQ